MDMKKILQAFDGATAKQPVGGAADMKKFVSIIRESTTPVSETVISSFEEGSVGGDANAFLLAADKINDEVMAQVNKIKINADEASLRDMMNKFNAFMTAYHNVGKGILQPDMFNDSMGESADLDEISDKTLRRYSQDAHTEIQGAKFGRGKGTPEGEKTIAKREKGMSAANKRLTARDDERRANYKRPEPAKGSSGPQDWYGQNRYMGDSVEQGVAEGERTMSRAAKGHEKYGKAGMAALAKAGREGAGEEKLDKIRDKHDKYNEGLSFADYLNLAEAKQKGVDGKACWDGYKRMGTKKKGGKTVDNCVPTGKK